MFRLLIDASIRRPGAVLLLAGLLLAVAGWVVPRLPLDVFPDLQAPTVVLMTEAGGLAADEVEQQVTAPLEAAVGGLPGLRKVRSASSLGLSILWVEFDWGEDVWRARQQVAERLASVRDRLPPQAHAEISPVTSITGEVLLLAVTPTDGTRTALDLRTFAEFDLTNRLLAIPGVAQVVAIGGDLPEYQVRCRQDRLQAWGLTVAEVAAAARQAHSTASAGFLPDHHGREVPIRQAAQVRRPEDIASTLVAWRDGVPVTVGDVAEVVLAPAQARGTAAVGGLPAVVVSVQKTPEVNTLDLTRRLETAIAALPVPAGMRVDARVFRQADFIQRSLDNLVKVLVEASVIVAVVLLGFLVSVRTTLITLVALPLSLAVAVLVFAATGQGLNVMTLGGLAVALGGLVDDAIIDVEQVMRRLGGLPATATHADRVATVARASQEIRQPMVVATVIIVLVFLPLLLLGGMEGRFFRPLGLAAIIAYLASLVVAASVTPALCRLLLTRLPRHGAEVDGWLVRRLKAAYRPTLAWCLAWKRTVVLASAGAALAALALASTFGTSFLPQFQEGAFQVQVMAAPGTSLAESDRLVRGLEQRLAALDGVEVVARRTGRAERDQHAEPPSASEINVTVTPGRERAVRAAVEDLLREVPGLTTSIGQPIEHRLSHILSGTPAAVAIVLGGDDLALLRQTVRDLEPRLTAVPGVRDVVANREVLVTTLPVRYRPDDLARAGLSPGEAAAQVEAALAGTHVATVADGPVRRDLVVRLHPEDRATPAQVADLLLVSPAGPRVRLREVADIGLEESSNLIAREQGRRKAVISLNIADGHNLGDVVARLRTTVDPVVREAGLTVTYGGQAEAQAQAARTIALAGVGVAAAVALLLAQVLGSWRGAAIVLLNLPLALIGGIAAVALTEGPDPLHNLLALVTGGDYRAPVLSIASLVGFITLFGIAIRNGILLVGQYQTHLAAGVPLAEAIRRGSEERLIAILMTALCAAIGLIPLALLAGEPGAELLAPLAVVVLGGLLTSTFLNGCVLPAASAWFLTHPSSESPCVSPPSSSPASPSDPP